MMSAARSRFPATRPTDELVIGEVKDTPEVVFSTLAAALGSERDALILRNGNADPIVAMRRN